jgi:hypothetical protein
VSIPLSGWLLSLIWLAARHEQANYSTPKNKAELAVPGWRINNESQAYKSLILSVFMGWHSSSKSIPNFMAIVK